MITGDQIAFFIGSAMAAICAFLIVVEIVKLFLPDNNKDKSNKSSHGH